MHSIIQAFAEGARPESIIDHKTRKTCLHLAVEFPSLHVVEFLLQNSPDAQNDQSDYPGPVNAEGNTILHKAILANLPPDYIRLITRKYPAAISHRNVMREDPAHLSKDAAVTEVLNQAATGAIPKNLHVDFNWELNPSKEAEAPSDDDIIDNSFENETSNLSKTIYREEPSTDPNILDASSHEDHTISSLNSSMTNTSISSKFGHQHQPFNPKLIAELQQTQQTAKSLKPVVRKKSSPTRAPIHPPVHPPVHQEPAKPKPKLSNSRPTSLVKSPTPTRSSLRDSLPSRQSFNTSTTTQPTPYPRTVQTSAIPSVANQERIQLQSDNGQFLVFESQMRKERNPSGSSNALPSRSESFPRGEAIFNNSKYQKRRSGHFETPEYSTPLARKEEPREEPVQKTRAPSQSTVAPTPPPPQMPPATSVPPEPSLPKRVRALYDCEGDEEDELTFCLGEVIQVTGREDEDWWIGNIEAHPHRKGCFPVIFVQAID